MSRQSCSDRSKSPVLFSDSRSWRWPVRPKLLRSLRRKPRPRRKQRRRQKPRRRPFGLWGKDELTTRYHKFLSEMLSEYTVADMTGSRKEQGWRDRKNQSRPEWYVEIDQCWFVIPFEHHDPMVPIAIWFFTVFSCSVTNEDISHDESCRYLPLWPFRFWKNRARSEAGQCLCGEGFTWNLWMAARLLDTFHVTLMPQVHTG